MISCQLKCLKTQAQRPGPPKGVGLQPERLGPVRGGAWLGVAGTRVPSGSAGDECFEATPGRSFAVEGHVVGIAHGGDAWVGEDLFVRRIAMLAGFEDNVSEDDDFIGFGFRELRKRDHSRRGHVVAHALAVFQRAMLPPDLARLGGHLFVGGELAFGNGEDVSINVLAHCVCSVWYLFEAEW